MTKTDTESTCEVVKVIAVDKHPNADRLEIAKFAFANGVIPDYQVVVGKGEFAVGDLAVYISDDMLVPTETRRFAFLKDKAKGGYCRIRACRLRGQMSTGLLVPAIDNDGWALGELGDDVSKQLGVVKYVNPLDRDSDLSNSPNYSPKRGSWLTRLAKRLGKLFYHPPQIPEYSVLSLRKVPDLFQEGEPVIITEKIHGSNIRFGKVSGRTYIGSHHREKSDSRPRLIRFVSGNRRTGPGYYGKNVWSHWFNRVFDSKEKVGELPNNIIFYGELFGPGIQPWTYGLSDTQVVIFDAWHVKEKRWLSYAEIVSVIPHQLSFAPFIAWNIPYSKDTIKKMSENNTGVDRLLPYAKCAGQKIEGVVVRSADWTKKGKFVSDSYLASEH